MKRSDVVLEFHGTARWRQVKTNVKLYDQRIESFNFPIKKSYWDLVAEHGPAVAALISKLRNERGVGSVYLQPYELSVHMAGVNQVTDKIRKIIEDFVYQSAVLEDMDDEGITMSISRLSEIPEIILVDFNFEISDKELIFKRRPAEKLFKGLNAALKKLLKAVISIDGVVEISAKDYQMVVVVAPLFDPEVISNKVGDALIEFVSGQPKVS